MRSITVLTAIILAVMMVPTGIYAIQNPKTSTNVTTPEEVALAYIRDGPTFSFDGMTSTLKVTDVIVNKSDPPQYVVAIGFVCLHGGYGDRTGKIVTQALTPHTAVVTVVEGKVISAVIDGTWNEAAQRPVSNDDLKPVIEAIALNWLINAPTFKFDGVAGSAKVTGSFLAMTFAAPGFWGVTIEFDCLHAGYGDRSSEMLAQVITHHVVNIHVTEGAVDFAVIDDVWDEVKQANVGEVTPTDTIVTIEEARDIVVNFIIAKYGLVGTLPTEWAVEDLIPQGIVGAQKTRYTSGEWTIIIENAVVWKPTYTVTISYSGADSAFTWEGIVPQGGPVQETSFQK